MDDAVCARHVGLLDCGSVDRDHLALDGDLELLAQEGGHLRGPGEGGGRRGRGGGEMDMSTCG